MKNFVITLGRQFGCGAHEIGTKLAERLDIAYYDKELIKRASKDSGFDENLFAFYDERPNRSFLFNVSVDGFSSFNGDNMSLEDKIFQYQFDTIKKVAKEKSCIIVGRCADYILRDMPNMCSVFLHGDDEYRIRRVIEEYGFSEKNAVKEIKTVDKKRARFHNFYCDNKWGDASSYNLSIDVSKLGIEKTADLIEYYVKQNFEK